MTKELRRCVQNGEDTGRMSALPPKPATQGHDKTLSKAVSQNTDLFVTYPRTREQFENNQNAHMKVVELANGIL